MKDMSNECVLFWEDGSIDMAKLSLAIEVTAIKEKKGRECLGNVIVPVT